MTTAFDDKMAAVALKLLAKFGVSGTFALPTGESANDNGAVSPAGSPVSYSALATPPQSYRSWEVDGKRILETDVFYYLAGRGLQFEPREGVLATINGKSLVTKSVRAFRSGDEVAAWKVQASE